MGSTVAIVVTAVAVILGFLILRDISDSGDGGTTPSGSVVTTNPSSERIAVVRRLARSEPACGSEKP